MTFTPLAQLTEKIPVYPSSPDELTSLVSRYPRTAAAIMAYGSDLFQAGAVLEVARKDGNVFAMNVVQASYEHRHENRLTILALLQELRKTHLTQQKET